MSHPPNSKQEAIDNLRQQIQPEQYIEALEQSKAVYLQRAAGLLTDHDMNKASSAIDERDVEMVNLRIDEALADLNWRIETIDQRIKDFANTKKDVTRPFERPESDEEPEEPTDTEAPLDAKSIEDVPLDKVEIQPDEPNEQTEAEDEAAREAVAIAEDALAAAPVAPEVVAAEDAAEESKYDQPEA